MARIGAGEFLDAICKVVGAQVAGFRGDVQTGSASLRDATRRKEHEKCHSEVKGIVTPSPLLDGRASAALSDGSNRRKKDLAADSMQSALVPLLGPKSLVSSPMRGRYGEETGDSAPGRPIIAGIESCTEDTPWVPSESLRRIRTAILQVRPDTNNWDLMKNLGERISRKAPNQGMLKTRLP